MKPFDPRLLRTARAARGVLSLGGLLTSPIARDHRLSWFSRSMTALARRFLRALGEGGAAGRVAEGAHDPSELPFLVGMAALAVVVRSAATWGMDTVAARGAIKVKSQLRGAALDALDQRSPARLEGGAAARSDAEFTTVLGRGLDALDGYFSGYVPQLILTAVATPILLLAVLFADPVSGITVLIVFPIIPVFMILIGLATQAVQDRQWDQLQRLSSSFLDAVSGLATLKIFGREERQSARIARETDEYRSRTMKVLRVTFLSGFVLDLAGTFSIALVAVTVGTRLVAGEFPLGLGLFVLLLLPEVFIPIRQVGAAFHASTEGLSASNEVFELIEADGAGSGSGASPSLAAAPGTGIALDGVRVERGGREVVGPVSLTVSPGEVVALAGPSGAGKSTLLAALLGFIGVSAGSLERTPELAWAGQRPGLLQGTVAENVALGDPAPDPELVTLALDRAGLPDLRSDLELGASGAGVSGGQAQRIAVARALYRAWRHEGAALLLDEPTSALDAASEAAVCAAMRSEASNGRAVLVVSHREAVLAAADRVVTIGAAA